MYARYAVVAVAVVNPLGPHRCQVVLVRDGVEEAAVERRQLVAHVLRGAHRIGRHVAEHAPVGGRTADEPVLGAGGGQDGVAPEVAVVELVAAGDIEKVSAPGPAPRPRTGRAGTGLTQLLRDEDRADNGVAER